MHTKISQIPPHTTSALINRNDTSRTSNRGGNRESSNDGRGYRRLEDAVPNIDTNGIICYYYCEPEHTKKTFLKLQNKNQCSQMAHIAVDIALVISSLDKGILIFVDEYAQFT